jgi:hypothetical protein
MLSIVTKPEAAEAPPTPSQGPVVLDLGGDIGAAIVYTEADLDRTEIEIRREGAAWDGTHVAVRERSSAGAQLHAAVFPHLHQGSYEVRRRPEDSRYGAEAFQVSGGVVTEHHFSS